MESKGKGASKTGTEDKYKWLAAIVKHSDITSVDWSLVCEEIGCPEGTMLKRWQTVRNEVLPGLTVKKMKSGENGKAKDKAATQTGGKGATSKRKSNAKGAGQKKKVKIEEECEDETFTDEEEVVNEAEGEGEIFTYAEDDENADETIYYEAA